MKFFVSLLISIISTQTFAQVEFSSSTFSIPPTMKSPKAQTTPEETKKVNPFSNPAPVSPTRKLELPNQINMSTKRDFINPGDEIVDKMNKKMSTGEGDPNIDYGVFRKNEYFGDFVTKGEFVIINVRDNQLVDGDKIRLYVNGKIEINEIMIDSYFQKLQISLQKGFNTIEFEILNEGLSSPNTTQYVVSDYQNNVKFGVTFAQATGFRSKLIVIRE